MASECAVCHKKITWAFSLCSKCESIYGRRVDEWPAWVRFLVNDSRRMRRAYQRDKASIVALDSNTDGFSMMNVELFVEAKLATYWATDGKEIELKDSDWDAVCDWSANV